MSLSALEVIWRPPPDLAGKMPMDIYRQHINKKFSQSHKTIRDLHSWTVANQQPFWLDLYSYLELIPPLPAGVKRAYDESLPMSSIPPFFEGLELNFAENVLENAKRHPKNIALIGLREGQDLDGPVEKVTWRALKEKVRKASNALRSCSVGKGDVVAALVSNSIEAVVLFLSTAAVGAVFTSISPDLGVEVRSTGGPPFCEMNRSL
jgi:acetoacetyl-CoA synthetase